MNRLFSTLLAASLAGSAMAQLPAFPGAEGFGALATGGRDSRTVVHVTNLNAEGAGSLAEALSGSDRIVVFDVGGVIELSPSQMVAIDGQNNITVLGQTAPGEGITIYGNRVLIRNCDNIIFRYIRMRGSINMGEDDETLTMDYANNVILDHCSISWGRWDNVHIKEANNITWQYCIISEGIAPQRFGAITDGTRNWTISHCLWVDNHSRNPKMKCYAQMVNSVVYNCGNGVVGGHSSADNYQDLIGNYYIAGPSGSSAYSQWTETDHLYQVDNYMDSNKDGELNGSLYTCSSATNMDYPHFSPDIAVTVETPEEAYAAVIDQAGCSRSRDEHDIRVINHVKSLGTLGALIDSEEDVGGIGTLNGGTKETDTDYDGIPDDWETENGLDPNDATDAVTLADDGYLWIEKYANSLASETSYLTAPTGVRVEYITSDKTACGIFWSNADDRASAILLERSYDSETWEQIDSFPAASTFRSVRDLDTEKVYYFRLRSTDGERYSGYSAVVSINEPEGTQAGGGTAAGTDPFVVEDGKLYRIICYASRYYNSAAALTGSAQYLTSGTQGSNTVLTTTTSFDYQDPELLWTITPANEDSTLFYIKTYKGGLSLMPTTTDDYITLDASGTASYSINYVGDKTASQSGADGTLSFYRINAPTNNNYQIRGKSATQWIWGSGTIDRADMIFTFQAIDSSLIGLYVKNLKAAIDEAESALSGSTSGSGTLQYPEEARDQLIADIEEASAYYANYKLFDATQEDIDSVQTVLETQLAAFYAQQKLTWGECDETMAYVIYSYGTASNSGTTSASTSTARRYLADYGNGLVFRVGLTDSEEASDTLMQVSNAQWLINAADTTTGTFVAKNVATGNYLYAAGASVSESEVTIYPVYNATDNSKYAFSLYSTPDNNRSLSIGAIDDDSLGGALTTFAGTANRTRLRWVFEATVEASTTGIKAIATASDASGDGAWYTLQGIRVATPTRGVYVKDGKKIVVK